MADSVRLQIMKAWETACNAAGKPTGVTVHRSRYLPLEEDELPAIVLYWVNEEDEPANVTGDLDRRLRCWAECRAKSHTPDDALDPLLVWAEEAAMADPKFGGVAKKTTVLGVRTSDEPILPPLGAAALELEIEYETPFGQPTVAK